VTDARPKKVKLKPRRPTLPLGPYLEGEHREVTPNGLRAVELLAANGAPQSKIASTLGFPLATFKKRLQANEHNNPLRLSWEKGRSDLEYEVATLLLDQARNGNAVSAIFYGKSQLNWVDTPQPTQQVGIQIVVPDSLSREAFAARQLPQVTVIEAPKPPVMEKYVPEPEPEPIFTPAGYEQ
jgi:hypothetical protein